MICRWVQEAVNHKHQQSNCNTQSHVNANAMPKCEFPGRPIGFFSLIVFHERWSQIARIWCWPGRACAGFNLLLTQSRVISMNMKRVFACKMCSLCLIFMASLAMINRGEVEIMHVTRHAHSNLGAANHCLVKTRHHMPIKLGCMHEQNFNAAARPSKMCS